MRNVSSVLLENLWFDVKPCTQAQTSRQGPLHTSLRANPFPNATNLLCQFLLLLSVLYYRPEATTLDKRLPHQQESWLGHEQTPSLEHDSQKNQSPGGGMGYWPHFQSVFLLEIYTGDAQIQPIVFVLQFNFKIWGAPKWVTFPPLAKPHCHISEPVLLYFDGYLLCCSKQTDILVVNPKHLHMLSLPKTHWCKYFEWCNFGVRLLQRPWLKNQAQISIG